MGTLEYVASWLSMLWIRCPLSRLGREVFFTILSQNSLEFRIAFLNYQIRRMFFGNA